MDMSKRIVRTVGAVGTLLDEAGTAVGTAVGTTVGAVGTAVGAVGTAVGAVVKKGKRFGTYAANKFAGTAQQDTVVKEFKQECQKADNALEELRKYFQDLEEHEVEIADATLKSYLLDFRNAKALQVEIQVSRKQLNQMGILINVFGRHNCGKSTLLNALLAESLLPMNVLNETGIGVKIYHSEGTPKLCKPEEGNPENVVADGVEAIYKFLQDANKESRHGRNSIISHRAARYFLNANIPILALGQQDWIVGFVDHPGFGEANQELMMQLTETSLKTSLAYLYILDVNQLGDEKDAHCFKLLCEGDKEIFEKQRVIIAVTHFDVTYGSRRHNTLSEDVVKSKVCEDIEIATGKPVSPRVIVPVCSEWALDARSLLNQPDDVDLRKDVINDLQKCPNLLRGENETLEGLSSEDLAKKLESQSGIVQLEERIKEMCANSVVIWMNALTANYSRYLGRAMNAVKAWKASKEQEIGAEWNTKLLPSFCSVKESRMKLLRVLEEDKESPESCYSQLLEKCREDVQVTKQKFEKLVPDFIGECQKRLAPDEEGEFGPDQYERELDFFLKDELIPKLDELLHATKGFKNTYKEHQNHLKKAEDALEDMMTDADSFLREACLETVAMDVTRQIKGISDSSDELDSVFTNPPPSYEKLRSQITVPPLQMGFWEQFGKRIRWYLRRLFGPPKYNYKPDDLQPTTTELKECVEGAANQYLDNVEEKVAEFFVGEYREKVKSKLDQFDTHYWKKMESKNDDVMKLKRDIDYLELKLVQIQSLKLDLQTKSDECIARLMSTQTDNV